MRRLAAKRILNHRFFAQLHQGGSFFPSYSCAQGNGGENLSSICSISRSSKGGGRPIRFHLEGKEEEKQRCDELARVWLDVCHAVRLGSLCFGSYTQLRGGSGRKKKIVGKSVRCIPWPPTHSSLCAYRVQVLITVLATP